MKEYSVTDLRAQFARLGYQWPDGLHLIGVRSKADAPDQFDDTLYLITPDSFLRYPCTTNPGVYWLKNWFNPKGCAVLKPGQYIDSWAIGKHRGLYEALVQCKPVTIYFDTNKDAKSDESGEQSTGLFGINIHRASDNWASKVVDKWSAGCQVLPNPANFTELMALCKLSGKQKFTYTLLNEF